MSILAEITGGTEVFIFKLDHDKKPSLFVTTCKGSSEELFSDTIIQAVLERGEGICIPNALSDPSYNHAHSIADLKLQSVICAPIAIAGKTIGLIYVGCRKAMHSFCEEDLTVLNLYATIAAMLINHVEYISHQSDALSKLTQSHEFEGIIYNSKVMQDLVTMLSSIASSDITVLLEGETGTGKSKFAQVIHQYSKRSQMPFVVVNCSALRGELLESELFGHKKGSFTGAISDHNGLFSAAHGGTIFLDEIGELELSLQAKLLRTLETGTIRPIGSTSEIDVDTRVICATNRNLTAMMTESCFRSDLYYRINQFSIEIPPLRKRGEDIILLAYFFLEKYKIQYPERDIFDFHPDTQRYIETYDWPGNIRELSNAIHRAVLTSKSPLVQFSTNSNKEHQFLNFETSVKTFQKDLIVRTIESCGGNKEDAARKLGLSRSTFYRYLSQFDL
jgi:transcriptional regulator with GAF, ATPase, and Fis domain